MNVFYHPGKDATHQQKVEVFYQVGDDVLRYQGRLCVPKVGESALIGPDSVHDAMENVQFIRDRLKTAQSRQKSYADVRRRDLDFQIDDWVFLKVSPMKGVMWFGKKGKLSSRYVGPYRILKRFGKEQGKDITGQKGAKKQKKLKTSNVDDRQDHSPTRAKLEGYKSRLEGKSQGKRARAKERVKASPSYQGTALDHESLHGLWYPPRLVVPTTTCGATRSGKAVAHQGCPKVGSPSRATSQPVVKTTALGKARGVAFTSWWPSQGG
ncbi:hypothetical protein MTR67_017462 [Solanum verrucosum]|uniref:Tf2-1-like SH3-like domain-containing protein n=1 Tax=Solanum verrucosum TaxID=315347 RepID=A0AAF0QJU7_SOLVR|nr:hypothetical protein MTR67_017462 [Solanum verrucosum]